MTAIPVEGPAAVPRYVRLVILAIACVLGFALGGTLRSTVLRLEGLDDVSAAPRASPGRPAATGALALSPAVFHRTPSVDDGLPPRGPRALPPDGPAARAAGPVTPSASASPPPTLAEAASPDTGRPLPARSGSGRRIVYQKSTMHLWVVGADGIVLRDYPVTGRPDRPRPGTYRVFSKSASSVSLSEPKVTFRWMVRFAWGEKARIGFHDIPRWASSGRTIQATRDLGEPIGRGGCVRQSPENARWLYGWADVGTTVVVLR